MVTGENKLTESEGDIDGQLRVMRGRIVFPSVTIARFIRQFVEAPYLADAALKDGFQICLKRLLLGREV